jgi:uncharacterized protein YjaZ
MEDTKKVTDTEKEKSEEMIPQSQVNGIVAKEVKNAIEKLLKDDLGVEDVKSAKDGISKFKEMQEAQKTDLQKLQDRLKELEEENATLKSEKKDREDIDNISSILKEKNIDTKYSKTIKKLIGPVEKINEELVLKTINEELPMLVSEEDIKVGTDKQPDKKIESGTKVYLDEKYKNNPYYKK